MEPTSIIPTEMRYPNDTALSLAWLQIREVIEGWRKLGHLLCPVEVHLFWGKPEFLWHIGQTRIEVDVVIPHHWHEHVIRDGLLEVGGLLCAGEQAAVRLTLEARRLARGLPLDDDAHLWQAEVALPWESGVKSGFIVRYAGIARWATSPKAAQELCIQAYHEALTGGKP